jgi:NADPH:quinone reductase-like Zn-dependent oxidoreductase
MKAFELTGFGIDKLALAERPMPSPGHGQALIKMRAWSLNFRDLLMARGLYNPRLKFPFLTLSDGVGEVVEVGPGVTRVKPGDRVAGAFMQGWTEGGLDDAKAQTALGGEIPGLAAEYAVLDQAGLVHVPVHLSDEEAATLPCAAVTAWNGLVTSGGVKAGETVLVQGTGGVSLFALQFAKLHGARIIATSSSDEKLQRVRALGADETINYKTTPEWGRAAKAMTGGRGVDHVIEVGGTGTLAQSLQAVRAGGHISLIGVLAGGTFDNPIPILLRNIRVQGIFVGSRAMFEDMNRAIAMHSLRPVVDRVFPFTDYPNALAHLESGAHFGKVVLKA